MIFAHFTNVHKRTDTRIRVKQTATLAQMTGKHVALFVQDGRGHAKDKATRVELIDVGAETDSRFLRMSYGAWCMWQAVRKARPKVAHFHDPELIPVGMLLKLSNIKVVYDVHEDVPRQILCKYWLPAILRWPLARAMEGLEWFAGMFLDAIVAATPKIARRFPVDKTVVVQNFPLLQEMVSPKIVPYIKRPQHFAYVGGITHTRGVLEMVESIGKLGSNEIRLKLAGNFNPSDLEVTVKTLPGWTMVDYLGWADRDRVTKLLGKVRAGLVVLHPTERYPDAYPVKMFEYMAAGLPVIASDFPLWRRIVNNAGCGILVNPLDPDAIADAMRWILNNPVAAEAMGKRGRRAVEEKYNWEQESKKLIQLYAILGSDKQL